MPIARRLSEHERLAVAASTQPVSVLAAHYAVSASHIRAIRRQPRTLPEVRALLAAAPDTPCRVVPASETRELVALALNGQLDRVVPCSPEVDDAASRSVTLPPADREASTCDT